MAKPISMKSKKLVRHRTTHILKVALLARFLVLCLTFITSLIIDDYDTSAQLLKLPHLAKSLIRWDSIHFYQIAKNGYEFENQFAFFPFLPKLIYWVNDAIGWDGNTTLVVVGLALSNLFMILATLVLYRLSIKVLNDEKLAYRSAILFTFTPCPAFLSSLYAEPLFALLTFSGIWLKINDMDWLAAITWLIAALTRSNGVLLAGFFLFDFITQTQFYPNLLMKLNRLISTLIKMITTVFGFGLIQIYAYQKACILIDQPLPEWCTYSLPIVYTYIQKRYWKTGFLLYFEFSQLPNFLLALPFTILAINMIIDYLKTNPTRVLSLGLVPTSTHQNGIYSKLALPHFYLWIIMTLYCLTCMHSQVLIRFVTSCPALYWYTAHKLNTQNPTTTNLILGYWILYGLSSIVLFAGFFPPA